MKKGLSEIVTYIGKLTIILASIGVSFFILAPFLSASSDVVAKNFALTAETAASAPAVIDTQFNLPVKSRIALPEELQQYNYIINTIFFDPEDPYLVCASESVIDCDAFTSAGELKGQLLEDVYCYKLYTPLRKTSGNVGQEVHVIRNNTHTLYPVPGDRVYAYTQIPYIRILGDSGDLVTYTGARIEPLESVTC